MTQRVNWCLAAAALAAAAAHPAVARPIAARGARKPSPRARVPAPPPPQEVLSEGVCRYTLTLGDEPIDEVRFAFRGADLTLPRRGKVTPVVVFRSYLPDLPEGAPESERGEYAQEVARFDLVEEAGAGPGPTSRPRATPGLPPGREAEVLGLPWLPLSTPRAGLSWERTETSHFPFLRDRFRYRITGLTSVGGRRAWRVERSLAGDLAAPRTVRELKTPARVVRWQETFWVDAGNRELLRAERRLQLVTRDETLGPVDTRLTVEVDWVRKGARPVAAADLKNRAQLFSRLADLERKVQEASARTTLDSVSDLKLLRHHVEELREGFPQKRYQPAFEKLDAAIERGILTYEERESAAQQSRAAP